VEIKAFILKLPRQDTLPSQQKLFCHLPCEQLRGGSGHTQSQPDPMKTSYCFSQISVAERLRRHHVIDRRGTGGGQGVVYGSNDVI
jgi:hypothetical protein